MVPLQGVDTVGIVPLYGVTFDSLVFIFHFLEVVKVRSPTLTNLQKPYSSNYVFLFSTHFMKCCASLVTCVFDKIQNYFYFEAKKSEAAIL